MSNVNEIVKTDNVYKKLARARVKLQKKNLKKSGENKFSKYKYFELSDFLPAINDIMDEEGLFSIVDINEKIGNLVIINTDCPEERIVFTIPSSEMDMKGANDIQMIGAVQTYMRRYLYVNCFEIAENDQIDSTEASKERSKQPSKETNKTVTTSNTNDLDSIKKELTALCKELADSGKRESVNKAILTKCKMPNPNRIDNIEDANHVLNLLKEIQKES